MRGHFKKRIAKVDPKKMVFMDESGINTAMTRTHGRGPPGERVPGTVPHGHWKTLTMIGALRLEGVVAAVTVDASTDTDVFGTFVHEALVPACVRATWSYGTDWRHIRSHACGRK